MPMESPNARLVPRPPPLHPIPPNPRYMLPRYNIEIDPNQPNAPPTTVQQIPTRQSIMKDYVKSMIAHNPVLMSNFVQGQDSQTFYTYYFRSAVLKGDANKLYAIQSNPICRIDLDKTIVGRGLTALQMVAASGFSDVLRVLFHFGASASIVDPNGNTALRLAIDRYNVSEFRSDGNGKLSDVAMLIGYTRIRTLQTNGLDTFLPADLEILKDERNKHFVDELKRTYPEFESLQL